MSKPKTSFKLPSFNLFGKKKNPLSSTGGIDFGNPNIKPVGGADVPNIKPGGGADVPNKPGTGGGWGSTVAVGLSSASMLALTLGQSAINAGAAVGGAAVVSDGLQNIVETLVENPIALAVIAGVIGIIILK